MKSNKWDHKTFSSNRKITLLRENTINILVTAVCSRVFLVSNILL